MPESQAMGQGSVQSGRFAPRDCPDEVQPFDPNGCLLEVADHEESL